MQNAIDLGPARKPFRNRDPRSMMSFEPDRQRPKPSESEIRLFRTRTRPEGFLGVVDQFCRPRV